MIVINHLDKEQNLIERINFDDPDTFFEFALDPEVSYQLHSINTSDPEEEEWLAVLFDAGMYRIFSCGQKLFLNDLMKDVTVVFKKENDEEAEDTCGRFYDYVDSLPGDQETTFIKVIGSNPEGLFVDLSYPPILN